MVSRINPASSDAMLPEFTQAFSVPSTQSTIAYNNNWEVHNTLQDASTSSAGSVLEFNLPGAPTGSYYNLRESFIRVQYAIARSASINYTTNVAPVYGFTSRIFERCDMQINGVSVSDNPQNYDIMHLVDSHLQKTKTELENESATSGYIKDTYNSTGLVFPAVDLRTSQTGLIGNVSLTVVGDGYNVGDTGALTGGTGTGATYIVNTVVAAGGAIKNMGVLSKGSGYSQADTLTLSGSYTVNAQIIVNSTTSSHNDPTKVRPDFDNNIGAQLRQRVFMGGLAPGAGAGQHQTVLHVPAIAAWRNTAMLPSECTVRLKLTRGKNSVLFYGDPTDMAAVAPKLNLVSCQLFVKRLILNPRADEALLKHMASGNTVKCSGMYMRQMTQRAAIGESEIIIRNAFGNPVRPQLLLMWVAEEGNLNGSQASPGGGTRSPLLRWEHKTAGGNNGFPTEVIATINGDQIPFRGFQVTSGEETIHGKGNCDLGVIYRAYQMSCKDPSSTPLDASDFSNITLYAFDCSKSGLQNHLLDSLEDTCNIEVRVKMNSPLTTPHVLGLITYTPSVCEIGGASGSRNVIMDN